MNDLCCYTKFLAPALLHIIGITIIASTIKTSFEEFDAEKQKELSALSVEIRDSFDLSKLPDKCTLKSYEITNQV